MTDQHTVLPITIETMRADVAAMLHEDPTEILDDDNLMEWGSIQCVL